MDEHLLFIHNASYQIIFSYQIRHCYTYPQSFYNYSEHIIVAGFKKKKVKLYFFKINICNWLLSNIDCVIFRIRYKELIATLITQNN